VIERRKRILIIEDDKPLADLYRSSLRFSGFDVDVAEDGVTALWKIEQNRPDLIVLDLHLPRLRGEAVLSEIAERPELRNTPVIVVTGSDARLTIQQAKAILRKPCYPELLVSIIQQHLVA